MATQYTQAQYDSDLADLRDYYRALLAERKTYVSGSALALPNVQTEDGGTTIDKVGYLKALDERIEKARADIDAHIKLKDTIDGGSQAPWTLETNTNLD